MADMGAKIKTLRKRQNMTQKELAELVNIDESMVNKIENGHSTGSVQTLSKIAAVLGISINELIERRYKE